MVVTSFCRSTQMRPAMRVKLREGAPDQTRAGALVRGAFVPLSPPAPPAFRERRPEIEGAVGGAHDRQALEPVARHEGTLLNVPLHAALGMRIEMQRRREAARDGDHIGLVSGAVGEPRAFDPVLPDCRNDLVALARVGDAHLGAGLAQRATKLHACCRCWWR